VQLAHDAEGHLLREVEIECLPTDIPEHIDVDISELMLNQSVRLKELAQDPKWKAVTDGETMLVHVVMPKAEESAQAAATRRTSRPAARAASAERPPGLSPTITRAPLSRRLSAWAWPWLPYPMMAKVRVARRRRSASAS